jgi:hypothetical protein
MRSLPLTGELRENVQSPDSGQGGDEEPALNREVTRGCSISDLAPLLVQDRELMRSPPLTGELQENVRSRT